MKALPKKLLPLTLFGIAVTSLFCARPAQANYIVTLQQVGPNVVATGMGAINLNGLTEQPRSAGTSIQPSLGNIVTGPNFRCDVYGFTITGPNSFGTGTKAFANDSSGDIVGMLFNGGNKPTIVVPVAYNGTNLSSSATYRDATFASLGVTPGTYVWSWGNGANQNFTLRIGAVPDGGSTVSLLGFGLLGLAALRRKVSSQERKS